MGSAGLLPSFSGAVQASLSVLLTIFYGVLASQFDLLDRPAAKKVSTICVKLFLPALMITNVGSELHADTGIRYVPILVWALFYTFVSMGIGLLSTKLFKFPAWVTPAACFNNTTALPLLLIESLSSTGILSRLVIGPEDGVTEALTRAKSYFLVNAVVGNSLTFAFGPRLLDCEHSSEESGKGEQEQGSGRDGEYHNGDIEHGQQGDGEDHEANEQTSLLPAAVIGPAQSIDKSAKEAVEEYWLKFNPRTQSALELFYDFFNAPLIGAIIGVIIGLTPPLHKAFFSEPNGTPSGNGIFTAWLTSSLQNIGNLFPSLQVVVVGVSLASSLRKAKRGESSGPVPLVPSLFVLFIRFIFWPVMSITIIWVFATKTSALADDPMLWFTMMLMPTGPTAMSLVSMADVNGADEDGKMSIAKFLTISYAISPLICFTVVASLRLSEAAI